MANESDRDFVEGIALRAAPARGIWAIYLVIAISLASAALIVPRVWNTEAVLQDHSASDELAGCRDQTSAEFSVKLVELLAAKAETQRDIVAGLALTTSGAPDAEIDQLVQRAQRDLERTWTTRPAPRRTRRATSAPAGVRGE